MDSTKVLKYLALGFAALYVIDIARKNGGTLSGNNHGVSLNGERIIDSIVPWLGIQNPVTHAIIKQGAKSFLNGLAGIK